MTKVVLVTGAARRIGAELVRAFHAQGANIVLHYHHSEAEALALQAELTLLRPNSVQLLKQDLLVASAWPLLIKQAAQFWQRLDVLINNASLFFPTPAATMSLAEQEAAWQGLLNCNLMAPYFLSLAARPWLEQVQGHIINITDIHADRPLKNYSIYTISKAGLAMLTRSLAREFAPAIRVNAIAPGAIIWPEAGNELNPPQKQHILERTPLKRHGDPQAISQAALYLDQACFVTGQTISVDGGRSIVD